MFENAAAQIRTIASNRSLGASELLDQALDVVEVIAHALSNPETSDNARARDLLDLLRHAQPSMASLLNLADQAREILDFQRDLHSRSAGLLELTQRWRLDQRRIGPDLGRQMRALLEGRTRVITFSRSGTVLAALRHARTPCPPGVPIFLSPALPGGEGIEAARKLQDMGYAVQLVADDRLAGELAADGIVLVGADAVLPSGIVNKSGTCALAVAAREKNVPVFVLCARDKFLAARLVAEYRLSPIFDLTPHDLVTGILSPGAELCI